MSLVRVCRCHRRPVLENDMSDTVRCVVTFEGVQFDLLDQATGRVDPVEHLAFTLRENETPGPAPEALRHRWGAAMFREPQYARPRGRR